MHKLVSRVARALFGLAIVFALGIGAHQALASAASGDCQPCFSQDECRLCCQPEDGFCTVTNACLCF